jgi:hypothetical protein
MDYFKLADEELKKVTYSMNYPEVDMVRIAKAEVYAKLAHSQVLREIHDA